ncbi:MAG: tRNA (N(6)-L-threonylcarbamoyladenosine(37)-C(2))-methylthiotransferase MtaB [Lachnospiraceae bacterium]|jgi:threonylcarbamoyladenosine tRNA methylthiotransferase MtaB|nr:tRNA (N(6)-L-threonylcarbamoyladenosine(37)-C(2))-methylthiotransferase MtaB [Lachnospiraceae bacterium]MCI1327387.1 tRNA (N(6)-L-threonylcarbamoyladenosine(37)-C(2))-methylthiotransferase MtaB [Lachnospiraceae bacterium]
MNHDKKSRKAALHNLGCKVNSYELEATRQLLEAAGYEIVPFEPGADLYIINTCTVTNIADRKSRQMLHRAKKMNPDAIVAAMGCYAQVRGAELEKDPAIDIVIGNNQRGKLLEVLSGISGGGRRDALININQTHEYEPISIDRAESHTRAFIKVQDGCNQFCSYCIIPYARGRVRSRDPESVVREVRSLAANGTREIVVTGIHVCSYGRDFHEDDALLHLLQKLNGIEGIDRIRLGSLEPASITREAAREMAKLDRLCPHFHLSLQSGCARTLERMNRGYTPEEYAEIVANLREAFDDPAITTDVIVGFPGETEEDFEESVRFVETIGFYETHIFPYSRRAGTRAADFPDQITERVRKERAAVLLKLNEKNRAAYLAKQIGREAEVLTEERIEAEGAAWWMGHTREYRKVLIPDPGDGAPNRMVRVVPTRILDGKYLAADSPDHGDSV